MVYLNLIYPLLHGVYANNLRTFSLVSISVKQNNSARSFFALKIKNSKAEAVSPTFKGLVREESLGLPFQDYNTVKPLKTDIP